MSNIIRIKRGLDIKLKGKASETLHQVDVKQFALKPTDFTGVFPKMLVKVGDKVKAGTPVFFDKYRENISFTSPVSGEITEIVRGEKRKMLEIRIESDGQFTSEDFGSADPLSLDSAAIIEKLMKSGVWTLIRQRPYTVVADPEAKPKGIFISAFDSAPLATNLDFALKGKAKDFQAGINALSKLTTGKVHLGIHANETKNEAFLKVQNAQVNSFTGPHPAGNVGVQIAKIDPINKGDVVWTVNAQDVAIIGKLFNEGIYKPERVIALCGSRVNEPSYYQVRLGSAVSPILKGKIIGDNNRIISGNVLTGTHIQQNGYLGAYQSEISVIPEGNVYSFFGWLIPSPKKHSFYHTALSWLTPNKEFDLNTNLNGGHRAFVVTGAMEKVLPMDIYLIPLLKAIMAEDIDQMENLGIYELDEEDIALCEYISTSKIDMQELLRKGLDMMRKEMS